MKPLALLFEQTEQDAAALREALEHLDLRVECYADPRKFLVDLKHHNPAVAFLDVSAPQIRTEVAIVKTVRSILGPTNMTIGIARKGDSSGARAILEAGANAVIEKPISLGELARLLSKTVVTDGISRYLQARPPAVSLPECPIADVPVPALVSWYFESMMPVLARLGGVLEHFDDAEQQFKHFAERLGPRGPEIESMIRILRKSEEKLDLLQSLRRYGLANTRALAVSIALADALDLVKFGFHAKTGLPEPEPKRVVPYATRSGEHFGEDSRYFQVAYNSGLVFDLLSYFAQAKGERKRQLLRQIENIYCDAIRGVDRALRAAKDARDLAQDQHVVTTIMMREAGRLLMAIYHEDHLKLREAFERRGVRASLQHIVENDFYGVSHNVIGALVCQVAPGLDRAYKAVLFFDYPFMLKGRTEDKDAYSLALLCQGS